VYKRQGKDKIHKKKRKQPQHINIVYGQIASIVYYSILFFGLSMIVPQFGINKEAIYALLGSIAIGIGLSAQPILINMWCGMIMIINNTYKADDVISLTIQNTPDKIVGRIIDINLFYTKIADLKTGDEVMISNNCVYASSISVNQSVNYS
jgi:small-conductance mechanosensitive channel